MEPAPFPSWYYRSRFVAADGSIDGSYADAIVVELLRGGPERVTMRSVAAHMNCTPSAVTHASGGRAGFLEMVVRCVGIRYANWLRAGSGSGTLFALPLHADEVHAVRVWRTLSEIAQGEERAGRPYLIELVEAFNAADADALDWRLNVPAAEVCWAKVPAVLAAVRGLREGMVCSRNPLPLANAAALMEVLSAQLTQR